ncbi:MAG: glutamate racemase [Phycisphaerae bacterium]|nr:glutamate racemase [Phycisphaerae bacterium]
MSDSRPIAILDSGLGGLCVAQAVRRAMPSEQVLFFGDTARVPYGNRSNEAITGFTRQVVRFLLQFNPKHVLIACNTATATALNQLRIEFPGVGLSGVIEPTARAAVEAAGARPAPVFAVMATEATLRSRAYERAIARRRNRASILLRPAGLLVAMIEEGRDAADPLVRLALRQYLHPLLERRADVLVLGCTHFAVYRTAIEQMAGGRMAVIDAVQRCADDVRRRLESAGCRRPGGAGALRCFVSDDPRRFQTVAGRLLGCTVDNPVHVPVDQLPSAAPVPVRAAG